MFEILYYINYNDTRKANSDLARTNFSFVVAIFFITIAPILHLLYWLDAYNVLNWFKYFDDSKIIRMSILIGSILVIYIYCHFNFFKKTKREAIAIKYNGKYESLTKYSLPLFMFLIIAPIGLTNLVCRIIFSFY